jgi:DNA-binding SARP family transcriptional activator/predicted RNase H-like HicB family nuclease
MMLQYRVIVVPGENDRYQAYVRAFPSLHVTGDTPEQTIDAARMEIARILAEYARDGRRPPAPDREAVAIKLVSVPFEAKAHYRPNVQIDVTAGKVLKDGAEVPMRGTTLELFVALATESRDVSIETLCERLYPGIGGDQAYAALKMCVHRARKQIGAGGVIETTENGYRLADNVIIDIRFLSQIVRAVRTRSVAKAIEARLDVIFADLIAGRPAAYSAWEWFSPIERTLKSATREIGLHLAESALRTGDSERALEIAQRLALLDPLDETVHELAIRVHLARGDRASALQTFRRYASDLQEQHGMEPSPALRALVEAAPS